MFHAFSKSILPVHKSMRRQFACGRSAKCINILCSYNLKSCDECIDKTRSYRLSVKAYLKEYIKNTIGIPCVQMKDSGSMMNCDMNSKE